MKEIDANNKGLSLKSLKMLKNLSVQDGDNLFQVY